MRRREVKSLLWTFTSWTKRAVDSRQHYSIIRISSLLQRFKAHSRDVLMKSGLEAEVEEYLRRRYEDLIAKIVRVSKEDLRMVCSGNSLETDVSRIICWDTSGPSCGWSSRMSPIS